MGKITSKHDTFIRAIMADKNIAIEYFQSYLPPFVAGQLDFSTLTQLPDVYVSSELQKTMSDIVYSCHRRDGKGEVKKTELGRLENMHVLTEAVVRQPEYIYS